MLNRLKWVGTHSNHVESVCKELRQCLSIRAAWLRGMLPLAWSRRGAILWVKEVKEICYFHVKSCLAGIASRGITLPRNVPDRG